MPEASGTSWVSSVSLMKVSNTCRSSGNMKARLILSLSARSSSSFPLTTVTGKNAPKSKSAAVAVCDNASKSSPATANANSCATLQGVSCRATKPRPRQSRPQGCSFLKRISASILRMSPMLPDSPLTTCKSLGAAAAAVSLSNLFTACRRRSGASAMQACSSRRPRSPKASAMLATPTSSSQSRSTKVGNSRRWLVNIAWSGRRVLPPKSGCAFLRSAARSTASSEGSSPVAFRASPREATVLLPR
mmetsp:Transcript_90780/g.290978  ORF Transcript_90780/g.290978 Transcript_90780/m.290978 type:complete len:247 (-) Transcript_90780:409-1149(-)